MSGEPAPLVSIPDAPAPPGAAEWFTGADGARLRAALFSPNGAARGSVVLSPGRSEPIEKYFEVVRELTGRGFTVLVHDWRGQGLSGRLHKDPLAGHARGWRTFLADYRRLLAAFEMRLPSPWLMLGHSMGGGLAALVLAEGEDRFAAAVLSAPMLGLNLGRLKPATALAVSGFMTLAGRGGVYATPAIDPFDETFDGNILTHDQRRFELFRAQLRARPDLRISAPTFGWLFFALALATRVRGAGRIDRLRIPLVMALAENEQLCDNPAAIALADRAPQGRWFMVEGAFHEILMETDARRAKFWAEFDAVADTVALQGAG